MEFPRALSLYTTHTQRKTTEHRGFIPLEVDISDRISCSSSSAQQVSESFKSSVTERREKVSADVHVCLLGGCGFLGTGLPT